LNAAGRNDRMNLFCTVVTRSYLPYASVLAESLATSGNPEALCVLVVDADRSELPPDHDNIRLLGFDFIRSDTPELIRYYFNAFELCNALKTHFVTALLRTGATKIIFLDSDIWVSDSFAPVWNGFGSASLQITPHLLVPPPLDSPVINEVDIADLGFLNGGFSAWRAGPGSERMLAWLCSRLPVYGFYRQNGMAADQKLLPLLLQYFPDDVIVSRNPGLNVAYWNYAERAVLPAPGGRWTIGDTPVVFYHFSGYRLTQPDFPCSYHSAKVNQALLRDQPWIKTVITIYRESLARHFSQHQPTAYAFDTFDGIRLTKEYRALIFRNGGLDRRSWAFLKAWLWEHLRIAKRFTMKVLAPTR
jgi:hypothetical protein